MSPLREVNDGLTREEIEGKIESATGELREEIHQDLQAAMDRQNVVLNRIADGTQAQLLGMTVLLGNPALNVKGVVNELKDQVQDVQGRLTSLEDRTTQQHVENSTRLERLEAGQNRIRRCIKWLGGHVSALKDDWKAVIWFGSAIGLTAKGLELLAWGKKAILAVWHSK